MSLYDRLVIEIFRRHNVGDRDEFVFEREETAEILSEWDERVKNLGDIPYTYRSGRRNLPKEITATGNWIIEPRGRGLYVFKQVSRSPYVICPVDLQKIHLLDATTDIILK